MQVNGIEKQIQDQCPLEELLKQEGCQKERIAVELNGEIVPKLQYQNTFLHLNDRLEIVSFVGGG